MGLAAEELQVLSNGAFNLGVARQRAPGADPKTLGRFLLGHAIVTNSVVDDNASSFLRQNLARPFGFIIAPSGHSSEY
ncbi:MAG: hypothetical protein ACO2Y9_10070 [Pseudohongiellaceae bacterium]